VYTKIKSFVSNTKTLFEKKNEVLFYQSNTCEDSIINSRTALQSARDTIPNLLGRSESFALVFFHLAPFVPLWLEIKITDGSGRRSTLNFRLGTVSDVA
jgi:hypothetical protein